MLPFLILVAGLAVAVGLLVIIGSIWMMTSNALIGYGFMVLLLVFPVITLPIGYTYYVVYVAFIDVKEEEMLDGLSDCSYVPNCSLVLEPLPPTATKGAVVQPLPDYQRF